MNWVTLGASGDLAPLAHLSLPLAGLGEVWINGERVPARAIQEETGLEPLHFKAKEALALLNGTQLSAAYARLVYPREPSLARPGQFQRCAGV
jgi:histidine ammonia-lyase